MNCTSCVICKLGKNDDREQSTHNAIYNMGTTATLGQNYDKENTINSTTYEANLTMTERGCVCVVGPYCA